MKDSAKGAVRLEEQVLSADEWLERPLWTWWGHSDDVTHQNRCIQWMLVAWMIYEYSGGVAEDQVICWHQKEAVDEEIPLRTSEKFWAPWGWREVPDSGHPVYNLTEGEANPRWTLRRLNNFAGEQGKLDSWQCCRQQISYNIPAGVQ